MLSYVRLADNPSPGELIPQTIPWVLLAGNPYYEWLFGNPELATRILDLWMRRRTSEVSILRVTILRSDGEIAGGFIGLDGLELKRSRKADAVAIFREVSAADRVSLMDRLSNSANLFLPVEDDEYYLSKMGLHSAFRGKGYGRLLLERYIEEGKARGHVRYRLDVHRDNVAAIRLYQSFGFRVASQAQTTDGALTYYAMVYEQG